MTFSIAVCDRETKQVGAAVTTSSIAVGSRCPWVRSGVGAVVTQNITDPGLGKAILDRIATGTSPKDSIEDVVRSSSFIEYRQLIVVNIVGCVSHYTGRKILGTNAVAIGDGCIAAGNLLASQDVPVAMVEAFESRDKENHLAESLVQSLEAGIRAGGEEGPVHSAALLVASRFSWPEVDLRVDWSESDAVDHLRSLWNSYSLELDDYLLRAVSPKEAPSYGVPGDL